MKTVYGWVRLLAHAQIVLFIEVNLYVSETITCTRAPACQFAFQVGYSFVGDKWSSGPVQLATSSLNPSWDQPRLIWHWLIGMWWGNRVSLSTQLSSEGMLLPPMLPCRGLSLHISWNDLSLPALDCSPWLSWIFSDDQFAPPHWILTTLLTEGATAISWVPLPFDMTSMPRWSFCRPFSSPAVRTVRAIQSGTTAVILSNYTCNGPCPPPYACRLQSRLRSSTIYPSFLFKIASRSYSYLPLDISCQVIHSRYIYSYCLSSCLFADPLRDPTDGT